MGALVAGCSTDPDIDLLLSDRAEETAAPTLTPTSAAPAPTAAPTTVGEQPGDTERPDGLAPVVAPDPTGLPSISDPDPAIVSGVLDNGLEYFVRENDNPGGSVELRLAVDAGSVLEEDDQSGVAHFLEHMMFNGTEEFPANELVDVLRGFGAAFGADINAYTDYDETVYQLTVPSNDDAVGTALEVFEQWLTAATIAEQDVVAERGVVMDEFRSRQENVSGRLADAYRQLYLDDTPYEGRAPIGTASAIAEMTPELLRSFYDDWYRPDLAAIVVVGDIDAGEVVREIEDRFGPAVPRRDPVARPEVDIEPSPDPRVERVADPDLPEGFVGFSLAGTTGTDSEPAEAELQRALYDTLAVEIIGERLSADARRGSGPFDEARVDVDEFVRDFDVPEVSVVADAPDLEAASQAVLDEFERVQRYGFTDEEVARAVAVMRRSAQSNYDGRDTRQDASFADEYVRHFLEAEPVPTAQATFDYFNAVLDLADPATVAYGIVERLAEPGYLIVAVPSAEDDATPGAEVFEAQLAGMGDRPVEPRDASAATVEALMDPPTPVDDGDVAPLVDNGTPLVDPLVITFDNGVRVALNANEIEDGVVRMSAASPGGLALVADEHIADADAAGRVLAASGVGDLDAVELERFLAGTDVGLVAGIDLFVDRFDGAAATTDLETLFQLVHLTMTAPRVDPVAVEQYLDDQLPFAADPGLDAGYAEAAAYRDARYDDPRYLLPTVESLAGVDAAGIADVVAERFGNAGGWSFSFSGDFDLDEGRRLAQAYLGTLPGDPVVEDPGFVEPPPPPGVVDVVTEGGTGAQGALGVYFSQPADPDRRADILARYVAETLTIRLTDVIREQLGGSYSAFANVTPTGGPEPFADVYVSASAAPDALDEVTAAVLAEIAAMAADGPTEGEYAAAREAILRETEYFSNGQINNEVLRVFVDPAVDTLDDYLDEAPIAASIDRDDVRDAFARWLPADQRIEVRTLPR